MLARDLLGTRAVTGLDRRDERVVLVLRDEQDLRCETCACDARREAGDANGNAITRATSRARISLFDSSSRCSWNVWLSPTYASTASGDGVADRLVELDEDVPERIELGRRLSRSAAKRTAVPSRTPRSSIASSIFDPREGAHRESATGKRFDEPLVLEAGQGEPERHPRDADSLDERQLGEALAERDVAVEDQLPEGQRGLDRLDVVPRGTARAYVRAYLHANCTRSA